MASFISHSSLGAKVAQKLGAKPAPTLRRLLVVRHHQLVTWTRAQRVHTSAVSAPSGPIAASYPVYEQLAVCSDWRQVQALWSKMRVETMSKDDIYCFLLQLQDFFNAAVPIEDMPKEEAFRYEVLRALEPHTHALDAEQLEAYACVMALCAGRKPTAQQAAAVYHRLSSLVEPASLAPSLNCVLALGMMGHTPQAAVLERIFGVAASACTRVSLRQWEALHHLACRYPFSVSPASLLKLTDCVTAYASITTVMDYSLLVAVTATLAAAVRRGGAAVDDVAPVVSVIEPLFDRGRSMLTLHQVTAFTSLLRSLASPAFTKWLLLFRDAVATADLAGQPAATLVAAAELLVSSGGWQGPNTPLLQSLLTALASQCPNTAAAATAGPRGADGVMAYAASAQAPLPAAQQGESVVVVLEWIAGLVKAAPSRGDEAGVAGVLRPVVAALVEGGARGQLDSLPPAQLPKLLATCATLKYAPSPAFVERAFECLADKAHRLDGKELLTALRAARDLKARPSHPLLSRLFEHQSRLLDDMRPTDYLAIIELMNTTRFSPSRATLVDLFTAASLSLGTGYERGAASTRAIFAPSPSSSPAHAHPAAPAAHNGSLSSPGAVAAAQLFTDAAPTASNNVLVYASGAAASLVSTAVGAAANGRSTSPQRTTSPSRTAPPAMNGASVSISSVTASSNPSPASSPQRPARGAAAAASAGRWVMSAALSGTGALPAAAPRPLLRPAEALRLLNGLTDLRELFSCHGIHEQIPEMCAFRSKVVDVLHKMSMEPQQHDE